MSTLEFHRLTGYRVSTLPSPVREIRHRTMDNMDVACEEKIEITYLGNSTPATMPRQFQRIFLL